ARAPKELLVARWRKDVERLRGEVERAERKLSNKGFVERADPHVVASEREKLDGYRTELARVHASLTEMGERT
ncbi:MAG: hypothetical protein JOZ38_02580, partial [Candidatus Eremiobacteraeota bacterium]|nr:hypothetical protein [Candidatus Eremiobacteraeota bacterium]